MSTMTVATTKAQKGFYPTPPALAAKLLDGIHIGTVQRILEPSAGTGNLTRALAPMIYPTTTAVPAMVIRSGMSIAVKLTRHCAVFSQKASLRRLSKT